MIVKKICILGGTGFVGRSLANRLAYAGHELRILTRNREANKKDLILLPKLDLIETDIHNSENLKTHLQGCDAVINLVGILNERGTNGAGFRHVHVDLTNKILTACQELGIKRLLQMSALNAATDGPSHYLRSKGEAENLVHACKNIQVTSYRPSVIFGPGDSFFNRFATLLKITPVFFPLACSKSRFTPLFIGDLTEAITQTLQNPEYYSKQLELCGPNTYSLLELVQYTAKCTGVKRIIFPLPDLISRIQASFFDLTGFLFNLVNMQKPFSTDNYMSLKMNSTTDRNDLIQIGITPTAVESIVPQYLDLSSYKSRYYKFRQSSRRRI